MKTSNRLLIFSHHITITWFVEKNYWQSRASSGQSKRKKSWSNSANGESQNSQRGLRCNILPNAVPKAITPSDVAWPKWTLFGQLIDSLTTTLPSLLSMKRALPFPHRLNLSFLQEPEKNNMYQICQTVPFL